MRHQKILNISTISWVSWKYKTSPRGNGLENQSYKHILFFWTARKSRNKRPRACPKHTHVETKKSVGTVHSRSEISGASEWMTQHQTQLSPGTILSTIRFNPNAAPGEAIPAYKRWDLPNEADEANEAELGGGRGRKKLLQRVPYIICLTDGFELR